MGERRSRTNHRHALAGSAGSPLPECSVSFAISTAPSVQKHNVNGTPHQVSSPVSREDVLSDMYQDKTESRYTQKNRPVIAINRAPPKRRMIGGRRGR